MPKGKRSSPASLADRFVERIAKARKNFRSSGSSRPTGIVYGISPSGEVRGSLDGKLAELTELLVRSGKIFAFRDEIVIEYGTADKAHLISVAGRERGSRNAGAMLANLIVAEWGGDDDASPSQFPLPGKITDALLLREPTRAALTQIRHYSRRPVLDENFVLRGPGYHPDIGTMVHSHHIEPASLGAVPAVSLAALQRLPHHLQRLLSDFCFLSDADLVNYVAMLITGVLSSHFVAEGKPIFTFDGNQPGVGKSLAATAAGIVLDGSVPTLNRYVTDDNEMEKQIVATARTCKQSLLIVDNARTAKGVAISSSVIESMSMSPLLSGRILGQSANFQRPNDLVWVLTMNSTQLSRDLATRSCAIQLAYEGDPTKRLFGNCSPHEYAMRYRAEILGELFGMVGRWTQAGLPVGPVPHRLNKWTRVVGGILQANGLPEFLTNQDRVVELFDETAVQLSALAEAALHIKDGPFLVGASSPAQGLADQKALAASDWVTIVSSAGLDRERLLIAKNDRAQATIVGNMLSPLVGRSVEIVVNSTLMRATLRVITGRAKKKKYYFELEQDSEAVVNAVVDSASDVEAAGELTTSPIAETVQDPVDLDGWVNP